MLLSDFIENEFRQFYKEEAFHHLYKAIKRKPRKAKDEKNGKVKVFSKEEIFLYKLKHLGKKIEGLQ